MTRGLSTGFKKITDSEWKYLLRKLGKRDDVLEGKDSIAFFPNGEAKLSENLHITIRRNWKTSTIYFDFPYKDHVKYPDIDDDSDSLMKKNLKYPKLKGKIIKSRTTQKVIEIINEIIEGYKDSKEYHQEQLKSQKRKEKSIKKLQKRRERRMQG